MTDGEGFPPEWMGGAPEHSDAEDGGVGLFVDPGLGERHPRQILHLMLVTSDWTYILSSQEVVQWTLTAAAARAPAFRESGHAGAGLFRFHDEPDGLWMGVDGPSGSALIVFRGPSADPDALDDLVCSRFRVDEPPLAVHIARYGAAPRPVVSLVADAGVMPLWEVPGFEALATPLPFGD